MGSVRNYPRFGRRYFLYRIGAILVGLSPFFLCELTLRGIGWQPPDSVRDPYVGFTEVRPLFEKNDASGRYEISRNRYPLFRPDSFQIHKPNNEFRIFCVGGSTVQGRPFAIETAFSTWLELSLQVADPAKQWRVVNCGGVSYASYRLTPIVNEIMAYEPDLVILYTGHNEFLEDRIYEPIKKTTPWVVHAHERLSSFKTYSFLRSCVVSSGGELPSEKTTEMPSEVEARLDFRGGLAKYTRDDDWNQNVVQHFDYNLRRMVNKAKSSGVPVIVCNPVCNLKDAAPFKSQNSDLPLVNLQEFQRLWKKMLDDESLPRNASREFELLQSLVKLDPRHAEAQFRLGQAYLQLGDFEKAKHHLIRAKDEDICPLRMIESLRDVINTTCNDCSVPMIDIEAFFEKREGHGIPGSESLLDHVHPTIHGHQLIAGLLMDQMVAKKWVKVTKDFEIAREARFKAHLESLPYMYFELGRDRLAGLKRWSEGRVTHEKQKPEN